MSNKRILITGAAGFIGSHLARRLVCDGHQVFALRTGGGGAPRLRDLESQLVELPVNMQDAGAVADAVWEVQPEIVYHLASTDFRTAETPAATHYRVIGLGTLAILEALREQGSGRLIVTGSAAEYGDGERLHEQMPLKPSTLLGAAKASAGILVETYARLYGMETVLLRLFTPYGPWEHPARLIPSAIAAALAGRPLKIRGGAQQRDFIYIDDVVEALVLAGQEQLPKPAVMNLCSGQGRAVRDVAALALVLAGSEAVPETGGAMRPDEIVTCSGDWREAERLLGWRPSTAIEQGLRATIEWFKENPEWGNCCN
ncbi:MAG: NAD-dependent epimerase/dehydratase family protein [Acidimicrobiia bacterium]|nr:NAD-dependent epimerase/dehydratase family protein [Acidimicrobiia bacterium]